MPANDDQQILADVAAADNTSLERLNSIANAGAGLFAPMMVYRLDQTYDMEGVGAVTITQCLGRNSQLSPQNAFGRMSASILDRTPD